MEAFLGEIRAFPYGFAPYGWQPCAGQILPIQQYAALFSLLGTNYGGNGTSTFGLPNLQGFTVTNAASGAPNGVNLVVGETTGTETVTLLTSEIPQHNHLFNGATGAGATRVATPGPTTYITNFEDSNKNAVRAYVNTSVNSTLAAQAITTSGGSIHHNNQSPFLVMGYYIAMSGIFPTRN
ncbi:tail fiber protein [Mucilaginibacter sp.]|uniref:phage tail protein n=1 Tax=Mucilaginibacter sp. TaxID=1882438 RepID=UPI002847354B|nr:tail fiber protein [Mucilaginibacter sp.]MDR3697520.1 tail fiber protein [Mucilaginibacter sp.]